MLDFLLRDDIILTNVIDCAIQELEILFSTSNTELIGHPMFGVNFETFLWKLVPEEEKIKEYVLNKIYINTFYAKNLLLDITVVKIDNVADFTYAVSINLTDPSNNKTGKYDFGL